MSSSGLVLIVCGGRDYEDSRAIYRALGRIKAERGVSMILHGGARGADSISQRWAESEGVETKVFDADWEAHGKAAGPMRNQAMADHGADGCVAFPGGIGTADMIRRATAAGIKVWQP